MSALQRLLDLVAGFGKGGDIAVVTTIRDEQLFAEFSNVRAMLDTLAVQMRVSKTGKVFQSAKVILVAAWTSSRHGLDPEFALSSIRTLGTSAVLEFEGDVSGISSALEAHAVTKQEEALVRAQAGKSLPSLAKKGATLVATYELQLAQGAPVADVAASIKATMEELEKVLAKTLIRS
jgi:hypothetical protein